MVKITLAHTQKLTRPYILIPFVLFTVLGLFFLIAIIKNSDKPYAWNGLVPGKSTLQEVESKLGKPLTTDFQNEQYIMKFPTKNNYRQNTIIIKNNILIAVFEEIIEKEKGNLNDYFKKYGQPDYQEFEGQYAELGFKLYVYPKKGIALSANPVDGTIIQFWYFEPTTVEEFKKSFITKETKQDAKNDHNYTNEEIFLPQ